VTERPAATVKPSQQGTGGPVAEIRASLEALNQPSPDWEKMDLRTVSEAAACLTGAYQSELHHRISEWVSCSPTAFGFSRELDQLARKAKAAAVVLSDQRRKDSPPIKRERARTLLTEAITAGLEQRVEYPLTDSERAIVAKLASLAAAGTHFPFDPDLTNAERAIIAKRRPTASGVRDLRICQRCGLVFRKPWAKVCDACYRFKGGRESKDSRHARLHDRGVELRQVAAVMFGPAGDLGHVVQRMPERTCRWRGCDAPVRQPNQRYCGRAHQQAAYRERAGS
jgi:hypothetical protein